METAEFKFNLSSEQFKVKLVEFKKSIKYFKRKKFVHILQVDTDLLKDDFAEWNNDELLYWSSIDSIERKNCFSKRTSKIENDYLNLIDEANKLILETLSRYASVDDPDSGVLSSIEYVKSYIKSSMYLPEFRSPRFTGDKDDWKMFASQFNFIYNGPMCSNDDERLLYLKALVGKGKGPSIEHYTNFKDAWQYLEQHFANPPM